MRPPFSYITAGRAPARKKEIPMNETALFKLSYGVYLCTTWDEGRPVGCVANSAMQITSSPATIAVSINRNNFTHGCILDTGYFALTVLGEHSDPKLIGRFGFTSARTTEKFEGVDYSVRGKLPVPNDGIAYLPCKVVDRWETATHTVFLGEVIDCDHLRKGKPMTYAYYHEVLKGKTSVNAPTFVKEEPKQPEEKYVCTVCGYEYEGDVPFEELPEDWVCPLCGMGKEQFEKRSAAPASGQEKSVWVCEICGYEYDGDIPFEELPADWVCPLCGVGKENFRRK